MKNVIFKINKDAACIFITFLTGLLFTLYFKEKHSISFLNLDEFMWMFRARFFMDAILRLDFQNLIYSPQPGIMVMWFTGPFMELVNYDFSRIQEMLQRLNENGGYNVINDPSRNYYAGYEYISFLFNVPIVALEAIFIATLYFLMNKIRFSRRSSFISVILIATTPYYVFFTTPSDKLVGIFGVLSLLSLLVFAGKKGGGKFLILSGFLGSWAALTKLSALFLVPFVAFALFYFKVEKKDIISGKKIWEKVQASAKEYAMWLAAFAVANIIFLPTIIFDPGQVKGLIFGETNSRYVAQGGGFTLLQSIGNYLADPFLLSFNIFIIIVFLVFLFLIIRKIEYKINVRKEIQILYIFVFSFFLFTALFGKEYSFRYLVPALIVFQILAGAGTHELSEIMAKKSRIYSRNETYVWALIFVLISQALLIYYSEIVPIV